MTVGSVCVSFYDSAGERIYCVAPRDGAPIGNIFWVHGLTDHAARQFESALALAEQGYRIILFDLQGHGGREMELSQTWWVKQAYLEGRGEPSMVSHRLRQEERGGSRPSPNLGKLQYDTLRRTTFDDHLRQFDRILTLLLESWWGGLPLFLFGHSMGGLICVEGLRRFGLSNRANLGGLILMAPAFQPIGRPNRRAENALLDKFWEISNRPAPFSFVRPLAKQVLDLNFPIDVSWGSRFVSDELEENQLVDNDPLCHRTVPSAYLSSIETQQVQTHRGALDHLPNTIVLLPQDDAIVKTSGTLSFAERARQAIGPSNVSLVRFPYLRAHHLLRSSVRMAAESVMADWLQKRSAIVGGN